MYTCVYIYIYIYIYINCELWTRARILASRKNVQGVFFVAHVTLLARFERRLPRSCAQRDRSPMRVGRHCGSVIHRPTEGVR